MYNNNNKTYSLNNEIINLGNFRVIIIRYLTLDKKEKKTMRTCE